MAIKVRCDGCRKKISMDEAFAGGVCRCPYCGELNMVPGAAGPSAVRPDRPDRPGMPGAPVAEVPGVAREDIPVASPVRVQGIVALVLAGLLVLLIAGFVIGYLLWAGADDVSPAPVNPLAKPGARIIDVEIKAPVVYVLDGGSGTGNFFDYGRALVRYSVRSLDADEAFQFLHVQPDEVRRLAPDFVGAGPAGDERVQSFLKNKMAFGATDLAGAVARAIALKPATVVLLSGKDPGGPEEVARLGEQAREAGVVVHCVGLGATPDVVEPMRQLAEPTGGTCQAFRMDELSDLLNGAPPLP